MIGITITLLSYLTSNLFSIGTNVWLSDWSSDASIKECKYHKNETFHEKSKVLRLGVYVGLGLAQTIFMLIATVTLNLSCLRGANILHNKMLVHIMNSPISTFFDVTPIGRILNRFSKDIDVIDVTLNASIRLLIIELFRSLSTIIIICIGTNLYNLGLMIPFSLVYFFIQKLYISSFRQLRRLESMSRSPIYSHFTETLSGTTTIKSFNMIQKFIQHLFNKIDQNNSCYYLSVISAKWLSTRLELFGNLIVFFTSIYSVYSRGTLSPGHAGLAISNSLTITATLNLLIRAKTELETNIVSVERILEYSSGKQESNSNENNKKSPKDWPKQGSVEFVNYTAKYRENLDTVLKCISFIIQPGQRVGVVGRTGAGKSSLALAIFRLIEPIEGTILIDGISIHDLGVHDLRSKLTIIPQEPVLFTGTIRFNIDPFNQFTDEQIWNVIESVNLKQFINSYDDQLGHKLNESGDSLSVGQKQLICLARALLKKTKIIVLDEATAAIDFETDELIQTTIKREFKGNVKDNFK